LSRQTECRQLEPSAHPKPAQPAVRGEDERKRDIAVYSSNESPALSVIVDFQDIHTHRSEDFRVLVVK